MRKAEAVESITETIATHLGSEASSGVLEMIRRRAQSELDAKRTEEASFRDQSIDPRLTVERARAKRDEAEDAAHEARRIAAAIDALDARLPVLKAAEHREAIMPAYEKFRDERAAFIERLRERWPKLSAEIVELLEGIERLRSGPGIEIPDGCDPLRGDVEAEARGCPANFYNGISLIQRLQNARIPNFEWSGNQPDLWPKSRW